MLVGLVAASLWSLPVHAQSPDSLARLAMMGDGPVLSIPLLLRFSDLTTEQQDQVRKIVAADSAAVQHLFNQLGEANNQLAQALVMPKDTPAKNAGRIVERLAHLRLQLMQRELGTVLAIRRVLTKEQLVKVAEAMDEIQNTGTASAHPLPGVN